MPETNCQLGKHTPFGGDDMEPVVAPLPDAQFIPLSWLSADATLTANSDQLVSSQKAIKLYIANLMGGMGSGGVVGPASSINGNVVVFDGGTGKLIKNGGTLGTGAFATIANYATTVALTATQNAAASDATTKANAAQAAAIAASQPVDSDLTAIAALATTSYGRNLLILADAGAARTALSLGSLATQNGAFSGTSSGTNTGDQDLSGYQPLDSDLTAIAALATTTFGRALLTLADAASGRTSLGLGTLATQNGTFSGNSSGTNTGDQDLSSYATQSYAQGLVTGLLDDRGNYNASGNAFPASGGSGASGAILKGDLWTVSVAGTLGGVAVTIGDIVRALVDTPGQTAGNWAVSETNLGYVAENVTNKVTAFSSPTDTQYPSAKLTKDQLDLKANLSGATFTGTIAATNLSGANTGDQTTITGNAGSASALQTSRTIAMTGDVAWSVSFNGSSNVTATGTIANDVVTYAKIQNVAASRLLGRGSAAGAGDVEEISIGAGLSLTGTVLSATTTAAIFLIKSAAYTAVAGDQIAANTTSAAFTITLPASPAVGAFVRISDAKATFDTNNLTAGRNGANIMGVASDFVIDEESADVWFVYIDSTTGWQVFAGLLPGGTGINDALECILSGPDSTTAGTTGRKARIAVVAPFTIAAADVLFVCGTAPTGSAALADIEKNGVSIYSTRPQINSGGTSSASGAVGTMTTNPTSFAAGDIIGIFIDQVGSSTAGAEYSLTANRKYT